MAQQQLPRPAVELRAPRRDQVLVEHALVEAMREAIARPERPVRQLVLTPTLECPVDAAEPLQPLFELELVSAREPARDRARELLAEDARRREQVPFGAGQRAEMRPHEVLHVL